MGSAFAASYRWDGSEETMDFTVPDTVFGYRVTALGGLSFRDIGAAYGKTETWARVTCFRARQRLKEEME